MSTEQYLRACSLVVADASGNGLDLSQLRIKFSVKKTDNQTPNTAEIRVYNLAGNTAKQIQKEFTQVVLKAGYEGNVGTIFSGNIKQIYRGREGNTDTYLDIQCGDGDNAYNYSNLNVTIAPGATQREQINAIAQSMGDRGVQVGYVSDSILDIPLPRGKVMFGMSRDYARRVGDSTNTSWSIQDGKLQFVNLKEVLPNQAVVINSKSGMIGTPQQTNKGIKVRSLLNPQLKICGKIHLNESDIQREKIAKAAENTNGNAPAAISNDGFYKLLVIEFNGDTRGKDWYSDMIVLDIDATAPTDDSVAESG